MGPSPENPFGRVGNLTGRWRGETPFINGVKRGGLTQESIKVLYEAVYLPIEEIFRGLGITDEGPVSHLTKPSNVRAVEQTIVKSFDQLNHYLGSKLK